MMRKIRALFRDDSGATALEYSLIAALIAVLMITGLQTLGKKSSAQFKCSATIVKKADTIKRPERFRRNCVRNRSK